MTMRTWQQPLMIEADHPSLPGHFPGRPIVPGVLLLDHVARALHVWRAWRLIGVVEAKFLQPLLPDQVASLTLHEAGEHTVRFEVRHGDAVLARGMVEGEATHG